MVDGQARSQAESAGDSPPAPPADRFAFITALGSSFGTRLLWILIAAQWLLKGFVFAFTLTALPWILKEYGVDGPMMQIYTALVMIPWALKPFFGLVSDMMPVNGYNKMPYMILASLVAVVAYSLIGFLPHGKFHVKIIVLCCHFGMVQISLLDLLTEAGYSAKIRLHPDQGPDLLTFVWIGITSGAIVATLIVGLVLEHLGVRVLYGLCTVPSAMVLIPICMNFLGESQRTPEEVQVHRAHMLAQPELVILCIVMTICALTLAAVALLQDSIIVSMWVAMALFVIIAAALLVFTRPMIGLMTCFMLIQSVLAITIEGGTFYFFTDDKDAYPEGPHFTKVFYTTGMGTVASMFSLLGMCAYYTWLKDCRYRPLYVAGNCLLVAIHACGVLVFTRYNLKLGIPDEIFMMGTVMIQSLVMQMLWLPTMVMLSHMCPKNMEATMFALMAGCSNLGSGIANFIGAGLLSYLGVTPNGSPGESAKFENLWVAGVIAAFVPMLTIFLIPFMVPDATQKERLLDSTSSAVEGSPWQRWRGTQRNSETLPLKESPDLKEV
jgi:hypothetical protein